MKEMKKPRSEDVEIPSQPEVKVDGSEKLSALSWVCHHAGQMTKGGAALLGLLAVGGLGYYFGRRQSASSSASSASSALSVVTDFSSALAIDATPTPISFIGAAAANKPLDLVYAESAENDDKKIEFGDAAAHKNKDTKTSSADVHAEKPNIATTVGMIAVPNLFVNGAIPDILLEVGRSWSWSINMTELFGKEVTLTQFSIKTWPDWLQNTAPRLEVAYPLLCDVYGVATRGNLAYIACAEDILGSTKGGLNIVDISDRTHPFEKPSVSGFDAYGVTVQGNLAYVACYVPR